MFVAKMDDTSGSAVLQGHLQDIGVTQSIYVSRDSYLFLSTESNVQRVANLPEVLWVLPLDPEHKVTSQ